MRFWQPQMGIDISHQTYPRVKYEKGFLVCPLYLNITVQFVTAKCPRPSQAPVNNHQNSAYTSEGFLSGYRVSSNHLRCKWYTESYWFTWNCGWYLSQRKRGLLIQTNLCLYQALIINWSCNMVSTRVGKKPNGLQQLNGKTVNLSYFVW